ncbi:hypothetical protein GTA51_04330 [Desulfovibrio aerotolerans]|uniref:Uncharacterized protein n=1 Tax=Solidesulfovibrio aerotolerans TaxID=295255 RepID=A0A7C9IJP1_9BACT|nr:hypothetical protein [Solidesulfovibrio aerotolerans]MYL82365.1 hypothetical protein [Solidesulfovibrio aerotolerans]
MSSAFFAFFGLGERLRVDLLAWDAAGNIATRTAATNSLGGLANRA